MYSNTGSGNSEGIKLDGDSSGPGVTDSTVRYNEIYENGEEGIRFDDYVTDCEISHNIIYDNGKSGILLEDSSFNNTLVNNTANSNKYGIYLEDMSDHNTLTNNTVNSNTHYGIYLSNADNNNITCNWVHHNDGRGFYLTTGSTGNNISYNNIITNGDCSGVGCEWDFYNGQTNNVNATNNYWGTSDEAQINASIYDYYDDPVNCGIVNFSGFLSNPSQCAPIPEAATIILFSLGLLVLAGYLRIKRKD